MTEVHVNCVYTCSMTDIFMHFQSTKIDENLFKAALISKFLLTTVCFPTLMHNMIISPQAGRQAVALSP